MTLLFPPGAACLLPRLNFKRIAKTLVLIFFIDSTPLAVCTPITARAIL